MTVISFEEFHTARKRQRAMEEAVKQGETEPVKKEGTEGSPHRVRSPSVASYFHASGKTSGDGESTRLPLGRLVESYEVQVVTIALIYLDVIASTFRLLLSQEPHDDDEHQVSAAILRVIESLTGFTLFFFILEIGSLMFIFGIRFFSHLGYGIDTIIITSCLVSELVNAGKSSRLLGFLRIWRVARLVSTTLDAAEAKHEDTRSNLCDVQDYAEKLKSKVAFLEDSNKNEVCHRKQVEKMLQGYKDEIETLGEALKIAAHDVAGVAYEELAEPKKQNAPYVDEDGDEFFDDGQQVKQQSLIVVHEDGTFEYK